MKKYLGFSGKKFFLGTLFLLFATQSNAQWLETTIAVDSVPDALVYNSTNNKVYCSSEDIYTVTVSDGATNGVITTIAVGNTPYALAYNPTNNKIYCANHGSNNVTVIDGAADSVITTIVVGVEPRALVYNPLNNKVYCANWSSDNVVAIDGASDSVITTITVGDAPWVFTWNPIQNRTYVANCFSANVSVIRDVTGIEEGGARSISKTYLVPTVFRGPLQLPACKTCRVFDVAGRVVIPEMIKPGIYFVQIDNEIVRKVVKIR